MKTSFDEQISELKAELEKAKQANVSPLSEEDGPDFLEVSKGGTVREVAKTIEAGDQQQPTEDFTVQTQIQLDSAGSTNEQSGDLVQLRILIEASEVQPQPDTALVDGLNGKIVKYKKKL